MDDLAREPVVAAEPAAGLADEPWNIRAWGLPRYAHATVRLQTRDSSGRQWISSAAFAANERGELDLRHANLLDASAVPGADRLLAAMRPVAECLTGTFEWSSSAPLRLDIHLEAGAQAVAHATVERIWASPPVTSAPLRSEQLVGEMFWSEHAGPVVLLLGGSSGATLSATAALLASRGISALALTYFGAAGLPATLSSVPVGYFLRAIDWLDRNERVSAIGVVGISRGGEAALLTAAMDRRIRAVACFNGSGVLFGAMGSGQPEAATWLLERNEIQHLPVAIDVDAARQATPLKPYTSTPAFERALAKAEAVERATVPVERIQGPILLAVGHSDGVWPSATLAELIDRRLRAHGRPAAIRLDYAAAGHRLGEPFRPGGVVVSSRGGLCRSLGGSGVESAAADLDAWPKLVSFLMGSLQ